MAATRSARPAEPSTERLRGYGREARDEGLAFLEAAGGLVTEVDRLARERVEAAPFSTLAVAFGVGVFLGGGLPFGALRFAGRVAAGVLVRELVAAALPESAPRA
jgi:hypothetical protein